MRKRKPPQSATTAKKIAPATSPSQPPGFLTDDDAAVASDAVVTGPAGAWQIVRALAESLPGAEVVHPSVTVRDGALLGVKVARRVLGSEERAGFERLAGAGLFTPSHLADLPAYGEALLYVREQVERAAGTSQATVPADVIEAATLLRKRMVKVLSFVFDDATAVGRDVAKARRAASYAEIAGALVTLGELYATHRATIERVPIHYRASDADGAATTGATMIQHLTRDDAEARAWVERQARVWTLFQNAYDEVCAAGRYLARHDPDVDARFPSLHSLNYVAPRREPEPPPSPPPAPG